MSAMTKLEADQFRTELRKNKSTPKLMANDFLKLKKYIFNDYLLHMKKYAGTETPRKAQ